jgi:proteasome lid subunit RPN8/RPN11
MRPVRIPASALVDMRRHARETYPDECCGFLIAGPDPPAPHTPRDVYSVLRAANEYEGERRRRFVIRPDELRSAERRLEGTAHLVAGFYHSHPDHPARPSQFDQDHAWPWYSYLVLSVTASETPAVGAFEFDPDSGLFREVELEIRDRAVVGVTESLSAPGER